jgi:hypothetical protein
MTEWRLYVGNRFTGIVVRPDEKYPSMFRIYRPTPSDMVNLTRAKDAALVSARIGGRGVFYWKYRETGSGEDREPDNRAGHPDSPQPLTVPQNAPASQGTAAAVQSARTGDESDEG